MTALALAGCTAAPDGATGANPNEGMLRDFLDGKYDGAGHPLNAKVFEAERDCAAAGPARGEAVELRAVCTLDLPMGSQRGPLTASARVRVTGLPASGDLVTLRFVGVDGDVAATHTLTVDRLREHASWVDVAAALPFGAAVRIEVLAAGATVELDYVEVFPTRLGVVIAPGSGTAADPDLVTFELPLGRQLDRFAAGDVDLLPRLEQLLEDGIATQTDTALRRVIVAPIGALVENRESITELHVRGAGDAARVQLRREAAACRYEGDPRGDKILVTGFQPFPADGWHDNVSAVAVAALDPAALRGAQVMRLVLPVEYDRAAAAIVDVIERCEPTAVISFGQGGHAIALEETSYNLQDTGEIAGGVPDNRGILRAAQVIDPAAERERATLLPLDAIEAALVDAGEAPARSTDPGRYICNNVMFSNIGTMALRGGRGGFIHLPYTTSFDEATRARFGRVVLAAVQATARP